MVPVQSFATEIEVPVQSVANRVDAQVVVPVHSVAIAVTVAVGFAVTGAGAGAAVVVVQVGSLVVGIWGAQEVAELVWELWIDADSELRCQGSFCSVAGTATLNGTRCDALNGALYGGRHGDGVGFLRAEVVAVLSTELERGRRH